MLRALSSRVAGHALAVAAAPCGPRQWGSCSIPTASLRLTCFQHLVAQAPTALTCSPRLIRPAPTAPVASGARPWTTTPEIVVIGCGGGGCNAVESFVPPLESTSGDSRDHAGHAPPVAESEHVGAMLGRTGSTLWSGNMVQFAGLNMDAQALKRSRIPTTIQLGKSLVHGLGAGANPNAAVHALRESAADVQSILKGANMVIVVVGLGGGTGTGIAPLICDICRRNGILVVAVATFPFWFEGKKRAEIAQWGLGRLDETADAVMVLPNDALRPALSKDVSLQSAFQSSNACVARSVDAIATTLETSGMMNLVFNDVRSVLGGGGRCFIGWGDAGLPDAVEVVSEKDTGDAEGQHVGEGSDGCARSDADAVDVSGGREKENEVPLEAADQLRAIQDIAPENQALLALHRATMHPVLRYANCRLDGASRILLNVIGGSHMTLGDVDVVAQAVQKQGAPDVQLLVGAHIDPSLGNTISVRVVGTGLSGPTDVRLGRRPRNDVGSSTPEKGGEGQWRGGSPTEVGSPLGVPVDWDRTRLRVSRVDCSSGATEGDEKAKKLFVPYVQQQQHRPAGADTGWAGVMKRWW